MINPDNITTIRVDQLPEDVVSLVNEFAHTNGTELKKATIQSLVDLVSAAVGAGSGVGFLPISVTDGQQLPDVPAEPSFFLAGIGTYMNINGYPDLICTEELNAIMSLTDHWEIAVEIPIAPLSGGVQSVTGSAVDNTDPLNPIINSTVGGGAVDSVNGQTGDVVLDIPTNTSDLINDGEDGVHPYITLLDLPSNLILYPTTVASDVSGYVKLVTDIHDPEYNEPAVDVSTGSITTTNQLISSLITVPDLISGNPGVFNISTVGNIRRTAGSGTAEFYFNVYKRDSLGTETLIGVSNPTLPVNNGVYAEFSATAIWDDGVFTATDRIVLKFYGSRIAGGSNPTYEFQFGGLTPVRTLVPIPLSVVPITATPTLQEVTDVGNTTTNDIVYEYETGLNTIGEIGLDMFDFISAENTTYANGYIIRNGFGYTFPNGIAGIVDVLKATSPKSASFDALNSVEYSTNGTITVTDSAPENNKGYIVHVVAGTTTIGGVGYTAGALVYRFYDGSSWISKDYGASSSIPNATETLAGIAEIATTAEVTTGTDDTRIVTPLKLKEVTDLKENVANKENTLLDNSITKYPTNNLVKNYITRDFNFENLVTNQLAYFLPTAGQATFPNIMRTGSITLSGNTIVNEEFSSVSFSTTIIAGTLSFQRGLAIQTTFLTSQYVYTTTQFQITSNVATTRFFIGYTRMYALSAPTNIDLTTMINTIGVCKLETSENLYFIYNNASGLATTIDCGVNFPANSLVNYIYIFNITKERNSVNKTLTLTRTDIDGSNPISTSIIVDESNFTPINMYSTALICNNSTAAIASFRHYGCISNKN